MITAVDAGLGGVRWRDALAYVGAQPTGGIVGVVIANVMFATAPISWSQHTRGGGALWLGEVVATFGLVLVVFGVVRSGQAWVAPFAVGAYITGAYLFTSSSSFANPAVTVARSLTGSFSGIALGSVPGFVAAQVIGGALGLAAAGFLWPKIATRAGVVVVPHSNL